MAFSKGLDLSFYQDKNETPNIQMDFLKAKAQGIEFTYIKASQANFQDPDFQMNRRNVKVSGLPYGFYHFLVFNISGKTQAQFYFNLIKDDKGLLPYVVDFEKRKGIVTPSNAKYILKDFLEELKRLSNNAPIIIYTSAYFFKDFGDKDVYWTQFGLWIASYSDQTYMEENVKNFTPWETWLIWQYTDRLPGLTYGAESLQIDGDYLNGNINDFLAQLAPDKTVDELKALVAALEARVANEVAERQALYKLIDSAIALLASYKN